MRRPHAVSYTLELGPGLFRELTLPLLVVVGRHRRHQKGEGLVNKGSNLPRPITSTQQPVSLNTGKHRQVSVGQAASKIMQAASKLSLTKRVSKNIGRAVRVEIDKKKNKFAKYRLLAVVKAVTPAQNFHVLSREDTIPISTR